MTCIVTTAPPSLPTLAGQRGELLEWMNDERTAAFVRFASGTVHVLLAEEFRLSPAPAG